MGKGGGASLGVAKLGSQDNSGKATYFSSRRLWRSRKNKKEKKEAVRPKIAKTANPEPLNPEPPHAPWYRDGLLASRPHSVKRDDCWGQLWVIQYESLTLTLETRPMGFAPKSRSPTQSSSPDCPSPLLNIRPLPLSPTCKE